MIPLVIDELYMYSIDFENGVYTVITNNEPVATIPFVLKEPEVRALKIRLDAIPVEGLPHSAFSDDGYELPDHSGVLPVYYIRFAWKQDKQRCCIILDKHCKEFSGSTAALGRALMDLYEFSKTLITGIPAIAAAPKSGTVMM